MNSSNEEITEIEVVKEKGQPAVAANAIICPAKVRVTSMKGIPVYVSDWEYRRSITNRRRKLYIVNLIKGQVEQNLSNPQRLARMDRSQSLSEAQRSTMAHTMNGGNKDTAGINAV
ncbi:hypothetical protein Tco_0165782 [Tanacetum coccineum]